MGHSRETAREKLINEAIESCWSAHNATGLREKIKLRKKADRAAEKAFGFTLDQVTSTSSAHDMLSVQWRDCEELEFWLTLEEIEQSTEAERIHDQDLTEAATNKD